MNLLLILVLFQMPETKGFSLYQSVKAVTFAHVTAWIGGTNPRQALALMYFETKCGQGDLLSHAGAQGPWQVMPDRRDKKGQLVKTQIAFGPAWLWHSWLLNSIAAGRKIAYMKQRDVCGRMWENCYNGSDAMNGSFRNAVLKVKAKMARIENRMWR